MSAPVQGVRCVRTTSADEGCVVPPVHPLSAVQNCTEGGKLSANGGTGPGGVGAPSSYATSGSSVPCTANRATGLVGVHASSTRLPDTTPIAAIDEASWQPA